MNNPGYLNARIDGDQAVKTLWHEAAHALTDVRTLDRGDGENIAEMAAYIGLSRFGIDTSDYSFPYVATWAREMVRFEKNVVAGQQIAKDLITAVTVGRSPWTLRAREGGR